MSMSILLLLLFPWLGSLAPLFFLIMPLLLLLRASVAFPFKIPPGGAKLAPGFLM
jgi:hypothetical protein